MNIEQLERNICVFGDSIVWGAWDKEKAGQVNRLAIYYQNSNDENIVYNLGIPSETTTDLLKRIKNELEYTLMKLGIKNYLKE